MPIVILLMGVCAVLLVAGGIGWLATDFEVAAGGFGPGSSSVTVPPLPETFSQSGKVCRFCGTGYLRTRERCSGCGAGVGG